MSAPLIIQSLKEKRAEIHAQIAAYQAQIAQAQHDMAHISAAIRLFTDLEYQRARYLVSHGFFRKGEVAGHLSTPPPRRGRAGQRVNWRNG